MKKSKYRVFLALLSCLLFALGVLFGFLFDFRFGAKEAQAATPARAECVVEVSSRRILSSRNESAPLPMASTTKVLTAAIVIEDCDLQEEVVIPPEGAGVEGSSVYLKAGERYTVEELLYGLMLRSGNDCAVTLALHHSGSIARFAQVMNERAAMMGAQDSYFENPHGLPSANHVTSARDLALISAYALENPTFAKIVSTKYYAPRNWKNKNKMLFEYDGALGVKTGFTTAAGRCLVTAAERNGMKTVSVVLNCGEMYLRSAELLNDAFQTYEIVQLCDKEFRYEGLQAKYDFFYPLTEAERELVRVEIEKNSPLPTVRGEIAGRMTISLSNRLLFSQNLYIM